MPQTEYLSGQQHYDKYKRDLEARSFYKSRAWQKCRSIVLARDNYLCQECLKQGKITPYDVVHHIKPRKEYPKVALNADNLVCLCHTCHNRQHLEKWRKKKSPKVKNRKIKVFESKPNQEII